MLKGKINSDKLFSFFSFIPLHPNHLTLLSVLSALTAFVIFPDYKLYSIILFALAFFIDAIDGVVARAKNLTSKKGAFIDGISDRLVEFFLILTIIVYFSFPAITTNLIIPADPLILVSAVCILFFGTCMTGYVKAYSHHQGVLTEEKAKKLGGILERAERVILLFITLILFVYFSEYAVYPLGFTALLSLITFMQRIYLVLKN